MPTYEYACTKCGHHLEVSQSFTDAPLETCPNCGGQLRKVFGSIGIVLKGSGFYKTDSRSSTSKSSSKDGVAEKAGKASSATSGDTSSTSSGSTPASDSSPKAPAKAASA